MFNNRIIMLLSVFSFMSFFGLSRQDKDSTMTVEQLKQQMINDSTIIILDVRTSVELVGPLGKIDKVINIPIQVLESRLGELEKYKDKEIAVICRSGNRSNTGMKILRDNGFRARNVLGGMIEYRRKEKIN